MPPLANNQETAELARSVASRLLAAAEESLAANVRVPAEKARVFGAVYSWWQLVCRTAQAVLFLLDRGFTVEVAPLMRNIFNHTYAIHWLVDNGDAAVDALVAVGDADRAKLAAKLKETDWPNAGEFQDAIDQYAAEQPGPNRTAEQERLHAKLKHEIGNVYDMLDHYGSANLYPLYSHLSSLSHTSVSTASCYLEPQADGSVMLRRTAAGLGHADIIQLTLSLLQAASVVSPLINGDPMRAAIDQAVEDLGLEGVQLLPTRVK